MNEAGEGEKQGVTPKLRFPEFWDGLEWRKKRLIDVCSRVTQGGTPDTSNSDYWNGSLEWLTPAEMGKIETRFISSTVRKITEKGLHNCSSDLLPVNSVIISTRAPIGHLAINSSPMAINQGCKGLVPKDFANSDFLYYSLLILKPLLIDLGAGNTFKELTGNSLKNFEISLPEINEQQKIADCLSSVDELIYAQSQKLEHLQAHKKGLMQQLFPAEGETVPKLRFPEFQGGLEWEEKPLGALGEIITGNTPSTAKPENYGGDILFISPADISDFRYVEITKTTLSQKGFNETRPVKANSILFVCIGSTIGKITQNRYKCATNQQINSIVPNENFSNAFVYYNLSKNSEKVAQIAGRHAVPIINKSTFASFTIRSPNILEQQKIAACLSSIDELIAAQSQKIDLLRAHKKGLMQQLFPSPDEARG